MPAHSSQVFTDAIGYGANYELARVLNEFRVKLSGEPNLTFNPGVIVGGTTAQLDGATSMAQAFGKSNVVSQTAEARGDLRAISPEQQQMAIDTMTAIVAQSLPGTSASISFSPGYPPMEPSDGNYRMLSIYNDISLDLGYGEVVAVNPRNAGAADISFVASEVEMAIDGLGLMGSGGHTVHEMADMATLPQQTQRAALLIHRLSQLD